MPNKAKAVEGKVEAKEEKPEIKLTKEELTLISNVLFNSRWNGQEWQQTIMPLINKLALLIDQLKDDK